MSARKLGKVCFVFAAVGQNKNQLRGGSGLGCCIRTSFWLICWYWEKQKEPPRFTKASTLLTNLGTFPISSFQFATCLQLGTACVQLNSAIPLLLLRWLYHMFTIHLDFLIRLLPTSIFIVYFCPQRHYIICVNLGPYNVLGRSRKFDY